MFRLVLAGLIMMVASFPTVAADKAASTKGSYVHVVLFTMKKGAPASATEEVVKDCHKLLAKIASVRSVKVGRPAKDASPTFVQRDYDLALLVLVDNHKGLTAYLEDPLHLEFVKKHEKNFEMKKIRVFDFANQEK